MDNTPIDEAHAYGESTLQDNIKTMQELLKVGMELNRDNFHVFVDYSGHVNKCSIRYYHGGSIGSPIYPVGHCVSFDEIPEAIRLLKEASGNNEEEIKKIRSSASETEYLRLKALFEGSN